MTFNLRCLRSAALIAALLSTPAAADQSSIVTPTAGPKTATEYATAVNAALLAIMSCNSGNSAPSNGVGGLPTPYQCWADTTTNPAVLKMYDGTSWVTFGKLNTSSHSWTPVRQGTDLGTASTANTGTSGANVPFLNGSNTWSGTQAFGSGVLSATSPTFTTPALGAATGSSLALGGATLGSNALAVTGTTQFNGPAFWNSANANAIAVGPNGITNPAFSVDASSASSATGLRIKSQAAGSAVNMFATSSGTNESLTIDAKGTGGVVIGSSSTGGVILGTGGGGVNATALTVTGSLSAPGLIDFGDIASSTISTCALYASANAASITAPSSVFCAETTTTYGTTTTFDLSTFINTAVTLTGNITTQTLSNVKAGQAGTITFIQDGTGSRTTVWNSVFKWAGGVVPALTVTAGAVDVLTFSCRSATFCIANLMKDVK